MNYSLKELEMTEDNKIFMDLMDKALLQPTLRMIVISDVWASSPMNNEEIKADFNRRFRPSAKRFGKQMIELFNGSKIHFISYNSTLRGVFVDEMVIVNQHLMTNPRNYDQVVFMQRSGVVVHKWSWEPDE